MSLDQELMERLRMEWERIEKDLEELGEELDQECGICGSTETAEISDEKQSITICAVCGAD